MSGLTHAEREGRLFRNLVLGCGIGACLVIVAALGVVIAELRRDVGIGRAWPGRGTAAPDAEGCGARGYRPDREAGLEPEPEPASGPRQGRVLAALRPRGLVLVDGVAEPADWRGPGEAPARGGAVLLTRSAGVDGWLAWPATGPGAGAARNRHAATAGGSDGARP